MVFQEVGVHRVATVDEAVDLLERLGEEGGLLGGGTWVLRAPLRGAPHKRHYVAVRDVVELSGVATSDPARLGALTTHAELGALEHGVGPLGALAEAARRSAFPAVRNVATLAGNLAARPFPEADLVPALLAGEAVLELAHVEGRERLDVATYLAQRDRRPPGELIVSVSLPAPATRRSWFERLTVRHAAEYSLTSVAISLDVDDGGLVADARVAVGAVEELPRRVEVAEERLRGSELRALPAAEAGRAAADTLNPRNALDAPGWYRLAVLPELFARAGARLAVG
jgi:carbon-monoxide dehydrogenase medium subunit